MGFSVTLKLDASQEVMEGAIRDLGSKLHRGGVGLFYFSGHAVQINGENYLIPVSAQIMEEKEVKYKAVNLGQVLEEMGEARNGLNIVILDACRNNPFVRSSRSTSRGLAQVDSPKGTLIAYATAPGSVASDGDGRNSMYTRHLLDAMRKPGLLVEQVFKEVSRGVRRETGDRQIPWISSSLTEDFVPNPDEKPVPPLLPRNYALTVKTMPANAQVRIPNIQDPKYSPGMRLEPGRYYIEVSAKGYRTRREWVTLDRNQVIRLELEKDEESPPPPDEKIRKIKGIVTDVRDNLSNLPNILGKIVAETGDNEDKAVSGLIKVMEDFQNDSSLRCKAGMLISISLRVKEPGIREKLIDFFTKIRNKIDSWELRREILVRLSELGADDLEDTLLYDIRQDRNPDVRLRAIYLAVRINPDKLEKVLLEVIRYDNHDSVVIETINGIVDIGRNNDRVAEILIHTMKNHRSSSVVSVAIQAISRLNLLIAINDLIEILNKPTEKYVKQGIIRTLGNFRDKRAVKPLIDILDTGRTSMYNIQYIVDALISIDDERAFIPLNKLLKKLSDIDDPEKSVKQKVKKYLDAKNYFR